LSDNDFFKFSYIKIFIFSLLVQNSDLFTITEIKETEEEFIKRYLSNVKYLIEETNDIVYGLEELAKNIIEHTGKNGKKGFGIISARIHKKEKLENLKDSFLNKWCTNDIHDSYFSFVDLNVIDSGFEDVSTKYAKNLQEEIRKYSQHKDESYNNLTSLLNKDLETIKKEKYTFSHFLNYERIILLHQIHRANARLGLLIFSNLVIGRGKGIIKISSTNINGQEGDHSYIFTNNEEEVVVDNSIEEEAFFLLGTNYNFILPIGYKGQKIISKQIENKFSGSSTSVLNPLFNYDVISLNGEYSQNDEDYSKRNLVVSIPQIILESYEKYEKVFLLSKTIIQESISKNNAVILINAELFQEVLLNSSDWLRLLACIQYSENNVQLIVTNLSDLIYQQMISICKIYDSATKEFWNEDRSVLFFIQKEYEFKYRKKINGTYQKLAIWFNSVLHGKTYIDYLSLNRSISQYHFNIYNITDYNETKHLNSVHPKILNNKLFSIDGKLLNFELLIKTQNDLTLYEETVKSLLNIDTCTLPDKIFEEENNTKEDRFFHQFKGYKVSDSHFKLGSKIHISDFYYAKRLFYNSFYSNRFAFLITKYLLKHVLYKYDKHEKLTLIGYSHYSELLVSNIRRLLEENEYNGIVNHDIVLEDGKVLKNAGKIQQNVIMIIPISSTFSTSDKMRNWIDKILKTNGHSRCKTIKKTDISVLLVADKEYEKFDKNDIKYSSFGWDKWENNNFLSKTLIKNNKSKQKYFIPLLTDWHPIHECKLCFKEERCLLDTGANSVSPESIFGFPIVRLKSNSQNVRFRDYINEENNSSLIVQRHIKRDNKHYKQYIKTGAFLKKDKSESIRRKKKSKVITWLENQRDIIRAENGKSVIIITPSRTANSGFVNMVNEYIFFDTATILQYSDSDDLLPNFIRFHSSFFFNSTVIFVDDVMHSSQSFHLINNYIKSIPFFPEETESVEKINQSTGFKTFDFCFCLFNRLSFFDERNVINSLSNNGKIFSFADLDIPPIMQKNYQFPDVLKGKLFDELATSSVTDMMKIHFHELSDSIKAYDVDTNSKEPDSDITHLFNFLVYKAINSFFNGEFRKNSEFIYSNVNVDLFVDSDKDKILAKLINYVYADNDVHEFLESEIGAWYRYEVETRIIYICSTPPFLYYKDIKETAFAWVDKKLKLFQSKIVNDDKFLENLNHCKGYDDNLQREIPTRYCEYQTFKLFLRLATELKSNYIFSLEMLEAIEKLLSWFNKIQPFQIINYSEKKIIKTSSNADIFNPISIELKILPQKGKTVFQIGFITYYTGLVQQLTYNEEAKAVELVKNIVKTVYKTNTSLRTDFNNHFVNLLRLLVLENTFIFETFHKTFYEEKLHELEKFTLERDVEENNFKIFKNKINETIQASRFQAVNEMCKKYEFENEKLTNTDDLLLYETFEKTMYLKTMLQNELIEKHGGEIKQKVNTILKYLCDILDIDKNKCGGGAFFTLRYKNLKENAEKIKSDDLYTIDNYATSENNRIKVDVTAQNSLVFELYKGISDVNSKKNKSTLEILYSDENKNYLSSFIESCDNNNKIDINNEFTETQQEQYFNNMFFLRISDIKKDMSHQGILMNYIGILTNLNHPDVYLNEIDDDNLRNVLIKDIEKIKTKQFDNLFIESIPNKELRASIINNLKRKADKDYDYIENVKGILLDAINNKASFKSNPKAVLCFYKCDLTNLNCDKCLCAEKHYCTKFNKTTKRFDPKRIRFLLLLSDDIRKFINHHLDNDSLRAFVEESKKIKELNSPDHNYYNNLDELNKCVTEEQKEKTKFKFIYSMLFDKKKLNKILENRTISNNEMQIIEVNQQINYYCQNIFREMENISISIDNDITIMFPEYVFRAILCEYLINASKHFKSVMPTLLNEKPSIHITGKQEGEKLILSINNNSVLDYEIIKHHITELKEKGYIERTSVKGLYLNALLLNALKCEAPSIEVTEPNNKNLYNFIVNLKVKSYEY
jgi:hypothetical protein